eukprot:4950731-Amphidinium_carterae.1
MIRPIAQKVFDCRLRRGEELLTLTEWASEQRHASVHPLKHLREARYLKLQEALGNFWAEVTKVKVKTRLETSDLDVSSSFANYRAGYRRMNLQPCYMFILAKAAWRKLNKANDGLLQPGFVICLQMSGFTQLS